MILAAYDSLHNYDDREIKISQFSGEDITNLYNSTETEFNAGGNTWTKSTSVTQTFAQISLTTPNFYTGDILTVLEGVGIDPNVFTNYGIDTYFDDYTGISASQLVGDDTGSHDYPCFGIQKDIVGSNTYYTCTQSMDQYTSYTNQVTNDDYNEGIIQLINIGDEEHNFYGFLTIKKSRYSTGESTEILFTYNRQFSNSVYVDPEVERDEVGFKPIKDTNDEGRGGGNRSGGIPKYISDILTQPGAPNESVASIVGSGYINVYKINKQNLANLGHCLFSDTLWTWYKGLTLGDPLDLIVSLNVFPCSPAGSGEAIKLGKYSCTIESLGALATGYAISAQYKVIHFGTLNIGEMFESYLDYLGTTCSLYLPFIGEVDIPISEVMGGSISVDYTVDFCTGACTANVLCTKTMSLKGVSMDTQYTQHSYQGNCACQIPLSSASYGNMVGNLISAGCMALSGNVVGATASFAGEAFSGGLAPTYKTKGNISANSGFCAVLYPYITLIRPITAEPESFQEVMGYPSYMDGKLATCKGLCICDNINLAGLSGATESEINRIKQICKEGIYV